MCLIRTKNLGNLLNLRYFFFPTVAFWFLGFQEWCQLLAWAQNLWRPFSEGCAVARLQPSYHFLLPPWWRHQPYRPCHERSGSSHRGVYKEFLIEVEYFSKWCLTESVFVVAVVLLPSAYARAVRSGDCCCVPTVFLPPCQWRPSGH